MTGPVTLRFYAELNDYLESQKREVERLVESPTEVGLIIETCGVPLAAVEMIVVEGESVGPDHRVGPGTRVGVFPVFEAFDVSSELRLRATAVRRTRFLVTSDLSALAALMNAAGHDVRLDNGARGDLASRARLDGRIVVAANADRVVGATHAVLVDASDPEDQYRQVVERLQLEG